MVIHPIQVHAVFFMHRVKKTKTGMQGNSIRMFRTYLVRKMRREIDHAFALLNWADPQP